MKFIHTADWQLGKPFGRFETALRSMLSQARFDTIDRIGALAQEHAIRHVFVAGDIFDTEGPDDRTITQALTRMERYACCWWLLPGNHDFARNRGLWDRVNMRITQGNSKGTRIVVLSEPAAQEIEFGVWLLPAPLLRRHNPDDPTAVFSAMQTPGAQLRIGLAHGSVTNFSGSSPGLSHNLIAPKRAYHDKLDYLALGDWHSTLRINDRTWYAGTPEDDRFPRGETAQASGHVLIVTLRPGMLPDVLPVRTGRYRWFERSWNVNDRLAFDAERKRFLEHVNAPETLLRLTLVGVTDLLQRVDILNHLESDLKHRLMYLETNTEDLVGRPGEEDLAALEAEGLLGLAARKLIVHADQGGEKGRLARRALERLFIEFQKVQQG